MLIYIRRYWHLVILAFLLLFVHSLFNVRTHFIKGEILATAISGDVEGIFPQIAWFVGVLIAMMLLNQLYIFLKLRVMSSVVRDIKNRIFDSCLRRDLSDLNQIDRSAVVARYTSDLNMVYSNALMMGSRFFEFAITILTSGVTLFLVNYKVGLLTITVFLIPMFITNALKGRISAAESNYVSTNQKHLGKLMKTLGGLEAIKNYSIEREVETIYDSSLDTLVKADIKRSFQRSLANGMSFFTTMFSQAAILIYSTWMLYRGEIQVANLVTIFSLVVVLRAPFYWISQVYEGVIASRPAMRSIRTLIDESSKRSHSREDSGSALEQGTVSVEELVFSYDGLDEDRVPIIDGLNLRIEPREKVWITGESGSGKSTLLKLLTGMLLPDRGSIRMGGEFSYFMQDAFLFAGSLKDNLTLYDDRISEEDIERVARICGIEDLLRDGRSVAEHGSNLSGGERRRIALARTLLYDKSIWILDEPLANIDPENIERIERAIVEDRDHTILLISHIGSEKLRQSMDQIVRLPLENMAGGLQ